jgi:uncharacterized repeat protein (TIGR01451 family)
MITKNKISVSFAIVSILAVVGMVVSFLPPLKAQATTWAVAKCDQATLHGYVETGGSPTDAWFEWWEKGSSTKRSTDHQEFQNDGPLTKTIYNLKENTTYSVQAVGYNSDDGRLEGEIIDFQTPPCEDETPQSSLYCAKDSNATPSPNYVNLGVKFEAFGGNGTYTWDLDGGQNSGGNTGSQVWPSWSTTGTKTLTVTSGGQTANCSVSIVSQAVADPRLTCDIDYNATPTPHLVNRGVKIEAFGGNGSYSWQLDGGHNSTGTNTQQVWPSWSTTGTKTVRVASGTQNCSVSVNVVADSTPPPSTPPLDCSIDYNATPSPFYVNKGVKIEAFGGNGSSTYSWNLDGGYNSTGTSGVQQVWPTWSTAGNKTVRVASGTQNCSVSLNILDVNVPPPSATPLRCSIDQNTTPTPHYVNRGVKIEAFGGNGPSSYVWNLAGGHNSTGTTGIQQVWPTWSTPGTRVVQVESGNSMCGVVVNIVEPSNNPPPSPVCMDPAANNYQVSYPCTYNQTQTCQNPDAINYGGSLPCRFSEEVDYCANNTTLTQAEFKRALDAGVITLHDITTSGNTATFHITNNTGCSAPISLSSYKMYDNVLSHQKLFDREGPVNLKTGSLSVSIPSCRTQIDAWYGSAPTTLLDSNPYGNPTNVPWVLKWAFSGSEFCSDTQPGAVSVDLVAHPTNINRGQSSVLSWTSQNASSCYAIWTSKTGVSGDHTVSPASTTTYNITCYGTNGGQDTDSATVYVNEINNNNFNVSCRANPNDAEVGERVRWSASTSGVDESQVDFDWSGDADGNDEEVTERYNREGTYRARVRATWNGQTDSDTCEVEVEDDDNIVRDVVRKPIINLRAAQTFVTSGGSTMISWSPTNNPTFCNASGGRPGDSWLGPKSTSSGTFPTGRLYAPTTYVMTCGNSAGTTIESVTVNVGNTVVYNPPRQTTTVRQVVLGATTDNSFVVINSSVDRPIVPTIDNTNPCPGDEINYTVNYQNMGSSTVKNLNLQIILPSEVTYLYSTNTTGRQPQILGNTLIFSQGNLAAKATGTVNVRVKVKETAQIGTLLNFPAILSYTTPSGAVQSVSANATATVSDLCSKKDDDKKDVNLGAAAFLSGGIWPNSLLGWLLLILFIIILLLLVKAIVGPSHPYPYHPPYPYMIPPAPAYPLPPAGYHSGGYPPGGNFPKKTTTIVEH